ncbi:hypothetical protein M6I34_07145 [Burkholderiaceae bacterium FT117]|uniref:hypothetical protein n=1 Tax=Zeimonas sediminis TaxID=2944268 RepID=UPI002342FAAF|nr:hypothetical protein [Zeimonas sediminis]MCM5570279.1 hypothetical protein [Zeimonas sediminis]
MKRSPESTRRPVSGSRIDPPDISRRQSLRIALTAGTVAVLGSAGSALAQGLRPIPADARFGQFSVLQYPEASIDGKTLRLAAGAQIRDARNMIVMPASLSGSHPALYQLDPAGQLSRVWLLAPEELEAAKARSSSK